VKVDHYPNSDLLAKENITFPRPVGAASFVKEIHSASLEMEEFFSGCGTAKTPVSMAL
jgi:hypothetical protein